MNMLKVIAVSAALLSTAGAANAFPIYAQGGISALENLGQASYATVESVTAGEARALMIDTDNAALQARLNNNKALTTSLAAQGFAVSDVVGIAGSGANVTLYVL